MNNELLLIPKIEEETVFGTIIYETVIGDHVYGTDFPDDEVQLRGVFIAKKQDVIGDKVIDIKVLDKNTVYYEISHFLNMLQKGDIEAIEMIHTTGDIVTKCSRKFFEHIIGKKNYYVKNTIFGLNIIDKIKKDISEISINESIATKLLCEINKQSDNNTYDFLQVLDKDSDFNKSMSFHEYFRKEQLKKVRIRSRYYAKSIEGFDPNIKFLMYSNENNPSLTEIINPKTGTFKEYEGKSNDILEGFIYFDKKKYDLHNLKYITDWHEQIDISSSDWIFDNKETKAYYNSRKLMHCIRLLNMTINLYKYNLLIVPLQDTKDAMLNILEGNIPLKNLLFDIVEKKLYLSKILEKHTDQKPITDSFIKTVLLDIRMSHYSK